MANYGLVVFLKVHSVKGCGEESGKLRFFFSE